MMLFAFLACCALLAFFLLVQKVNENSWGSEQNLRGVDVDSNASTSIDADIPLDTSQASQETVTLMTSQGDIIISLRPNQSPDSVQYIKALLDSPKPCKKCRLYRAEQRGILQGILAKEGMAPNEVLGNCPLSPEELEEYRQEDEENANAACHGPIMTRGMVGWAAGEGGPDFFIDYYEKPADWWGHDHTVFGEIVDQTSLDIVKGFFDLPAHRDGLMFLDEPVSIELK